MPCMMHTSRLVDIVVTWTHHTWRPIRDQPRSVFHMHINMSWGHDYLSRWSMSRSQMTHTPELGSYAAIMVAWPLWLGRLVSKTDSVSLSCTNVQVCHAMHDAYFQAGWYSGDLNPSQFLWKRFNYLRNLQFYSYITSIATIQFRRKDWDFRKTNSDGQRKATNSVFIISPCQLLHYRY